MQNPHACRARLLTQVKPEIPGATVEPKYAFRGCERYGINDMLHCNSGANFRPSLPLSEPRGDETG